MRTNVVVLSASNTTEQMQEILKPVLSAVSDSSRDKSTGCLVGVVTRADISERLETRVVTPFQRARSANSCAKILWKPIPTSRCVLSFIGWPKKID